MTIIQTRRGVLQEYIIMGSRYIFLKKINEVKRNDIEPIFNDISKDGKYATANQFLVTLSSIFNKAKKWGLIENNPTLAIEKHKLQAREIRLSYDEMGRFLQI
ncbi:hypothetical protein [Orientia tsutsugamushi]|uniref:Integrase n=2 Tax=Orientia tsutsugamushi TaxID=784 RepID=A0A2R8EZT4_ORITS|nr:hypothetical protein [Orientia tsutsugamushi]KJV74356.1 putative integrase [Orientia tsutsugamushi str. TA716]SPM44609.1 integrase [Orientia tsutsugamushi]